MQQTFLKPYITESLCFNWQRGPSWEVLLWGFHDSIPTRFYWFSLSSLLPLLPPKRLLFHMPCKCWCCIRIYPCSLPLTLNQLCGSSCCSRGSNDHRSADGHQIHLSSPHPTGSLIPSHPPQWFARANCTHLFPTLYSATTHWLLEIGLRGSIHTMAFNQCYQSGLC